jgi:hypothetical protein
MWLQSHHMIQSQFCFCIAACDILTQNINCERFFIISIFSKTIENLRLHFWKISYQQNFLFLLISCTRKRHSTVIESYIREDNVIRCEFDLAFIEKIDSLFDFHKWLSRDCNKFSQIVVAKNVDRFSQIAVAKMFCWDDNYSIFKTTRNWINLFLINDFVKSSIIIWSINT